MEPKNFLFVSIDALITDIAWHILKEGHNVKYYIQTQTQKEIGDGFVPKIDNWEQEVAWADVIVFDDVLGEGTKAKKLRDEGKPVVGGTPYTDKLEDDRAFGQAELKKAGVPIISHENFTSFDDAIEFVRGNPGKYVIKPSGEAQNLKQLLFVGQEDDGRDVIQVLEHYNRIWSHRIKEFQIQKKIGGVEVAVGAFFNGTEFIHPINVNFEHKKMFNGNIGPSTGEMGCYDNKTEVLTKRGWKLFKDVTWDDEFLTINGGGVIEYHKPDRIVCVNTHRKLLSIRNQTIDLAVTLNHNMYGIEANKYRGGGRSFGFVQAKDLPNQFVIPRTAEWVGREERLFRLPSVRVGHREGKTVMERESGEIKIRMDDWLRFLGYYIAEGSCSEGYKISLACIDSRGEVKKMLSRLPIKFKENRHEFYTYSKQLWTYLKRYGISHTKRVPEFVKSLSKRQIKLFLEWYGKGDANFNNGFRIFYTNSKKLADDIQELLLKTGRVGVIKTRKRSGMVWIKDHWARINHPQYEVLERVEKTVSWLDKRDMEVVDYGDRVYCVTVPNHTLYVRRNGKPCFCGNTSMFWSEPNKIFNSTLKKMESVLREEKYVGYIDVNCIVNSYGIYPLEFTARFGYPTISIQQESMLAPIGEFLYELARGGKPELKVRSGFQVGVRILVPPYPFTDDKTFETNSKDAVVVFKKPNYDGVHIEDVRKINGDWVITGDSGVALIVVGCGQTMKQAKNRAYSRISNILLPNMYYRTDIGDRWEEDGDRLHTWGYLR